MKKYIFLTISLLFPLFLFSQNINAVLDFGRFKATDSTTILEVYLSVDAGSIKLLKKGENLYKGNVLMTFIASDASGIKLANKFSIESPDFTSEKTNTMFIVQKRFLLNNADYTIKVELKDENTSDSSFTAIVPLKISYPKEFISLSDIQLLESYQKTTTENDYYKNGFELLTYNSNFFPSEITKIKFYTEIYQTDKLFGANQPYVVQVSVQDKDGKLAGEALKKMKFTSRDINVLLTELDISTVPSGNFFLTVDIKDPNGKITAKQTKFIQRSNSVLAMTADSNRVFSYKGTFVESIPKDKMSYYLKALQPIALKEDYRFIVAVANRNDEDQMKNYFYTFWKKIDEVKPDLAWYDYHERLKIAEQKYAAKGFEIYQTDRARVLLQYGKPYRIDNEITDPQRNARDSNPIPYEIWSYNKIGSQTNKQFCFVQPSLGNYNYRLVHSNMRGEVTNPTWRSQYTNTRNFGSGVNEDLDQNGKIVR